MAGFRTVCAAPRRARAEQVAGTARRPISARVTDLVPAVRVAADEFGALHPPKSDKPREVPLGDDVLAALEGHRHLRTHVFDSAEGSILTVGQCRKAMDRIGKRAGLRQLGWHVLRHTFASHLVMRGATLKSVQELGGSASMSMVLRYAHLSADARRDAVRLLGREERGVTAGVTTEGRGSRAQR